MAPPAKTMTYEQIIQNLEGRGIMPKTAPALEPTRKALAALGLRDWPFFKDFKRDPYKVVIVAGTNGKGSVCATLEALLLSAGERVGLYTSPHLEDTTERIRIGGHDVSRELFMRAFHAVDEALKGMPLTHFEMITVMAVWLFASGKAMPPVDRILLEVGLGGLWDATNAVPHGACVITPLGLDHQNFLGPTLVDIAKNKFAVVPRETELGRPALVVHAKLPPETVALARQIQSATGSRWVEARSGRAIAETSRAGEPVYRLESPWGLAQLALAGARGADNSMTALTTFEALGFDPAAHLEALAHVRWPGRMEKAATEPCPVYLSGDHNEQGVRSLLELLPNYKRAHLHILAGIGADKDSESMLKLLANVPASSLYLTETPFKGRALGEYGQWKDRVKGAWPAPEEAIKNVLSRARFEDLVVVTGSLYLVGTVRRWLRENTKT